MVRIIDRLVLRRFVGAYLAFATILITIYTLADLFTHVERFAPEPGGRSLGVAMLVHYSVQVPEVYYLFAPFVSLAAGMWVVASLRRSNELIPLMAAGVRPARIVAPIFVASAALASVMWLDREVVIPRLSSLRREQSRFTEKEWLLGWPVPDRVGGVLTPRLYWTRDRRLIEPRYSLLSPDGKETLSVIAGTADPCPGGWLLKDGFIVRSGEVDAIEKIPPGGWLLETDITPSDVECAIDDLQSLSSAQLRQQIARMPGLRRNLEVQLARRVSWPAATVVLLLLGLPFVLQEQRAGPAIGLLACMALCALFFVTNAMFEDMGARPGHLDPAIAAWVADAVFGAIGAIALARKQV